MASGLYDQERAGERWLIGAEQPAAMLLARWAVPQIGARVYGLVERACAGDTALEIALDLGLGLTETHVLIAHWSPLPTRSYARQHARPHRFLELSQPPGDR